MKINNNRLKNRMRFSDLEIGDVFIIYGSTSEVPHIKIIDVTDKDKDCFNSVELGNGAITYVSSYQDVIKINCELTIS